MRSPVVSESLWGNTEEVAQGLAAGLDATMTVDVRKVGPLPQCRPTRWTCWSSAVPHIRSRCRAVSHLVRSCRAWCEQRRGWVRD